MISIAAESGDYSITSGELVFEASTEPIACASGIMILQDQVLEDEETFFLSLESSDLWVNLDPVASTLTIEIRDANSKYRRGQQLCIFKMPFSCSRYIGLQVSSRGWSRVF